mmetsp:Transcript_23003/g.42348  ORF Transcript_23003/g.42348 Transcript_23003/m.42348 type:complete len:212 (+) Transcript_23003:183-818(+)
MIALRLSDLLRGCSPAVDVREVATASLLMGGNTTGVVAVRGMNCGLLGVPALLPILAASLPALSSVTPVMNVPEPDRATDGPASSCEVNFCHLCPASALISNGRGRINEDGSSVGAEKAMSILLRRLRRIWSNSSSLKSSLSRSWSAGPSWPPAAPSAFGRPMSMLSWPESGSYTASCRSPRFMVPGFSSLTLRSFCLPKRRRGGLACRWR